MATVLVVDDHPDLCNLLGRLLRTCGHETTCVYDGAAALAHVRGTPTALVILDVTMPVMDGLDVLGALKAHPATRAVPVVMHTAISDPAVCRQALAMGAEAYVVKGQTELPELRVLVDKYARSTTSSRAGV